MSVRKIAAIRACLVISVWLLPLVAVIAAIPPDHPEINDSLARESVANQLGWISAPINQCQGYYLEAPFPYSPPSEQDTVQVTGNETLFAQHGTSIMEEAILSRSGQEIRAKKAYLYRDPLTGKLSVAEMIGDVRLREPNTLIIGKKGRYYFPTKTKSLLDVVYRSTLNHPAHPTDSSKKAHKITSMTAWGEAHEASQAEPGIYELWQTSYTTCPPTNPSWHVKASHIVLNKNTGRGYATHARLYVKNMPIFYAPYLNFPIDDRRKTGFLWPTIGHSSKWGEYFLAPFYWNIAPNFDMTITPAILSARGLQLSDHVRYLTSTSEGDLNISILPYDRKFQDFQNNPPPSPTAAEQNPNITQAELNRLLGANPTRKGFFWRDDSHFNDRWSSHVDFNYASDDYYMQDLGSKLNEVTENQLLQEGDLYYKSPNWNFTGRVQAYETLHPFQAPLTLNQYRRFPQLELNGDYPDQPLGLDYFVTNDVTHFEIRNTPGNIANLPTGNRLHTQPGVSLPLSWPYFYINPRIQLALTDYNLYQTTQTKAPNSKHRAVPIFDIASKIALNRDTSFFGHAFQQTLEPQAYYTYIPYRNQSSIPIFDTTVNTLVYDQLFNYNRFSGIDRIGDANQLGVGVATRLIDQTSGFEKVRLGIGEILYFSNRRVTLCNDQSCTDNPSNNDNHRRLSPISGLFNYNINPAWSLGTNAIWNPVTKQMDNTTVSLHYQADEVRMINFGYSYLHSGDVLAGGTTNTQQNQQQNNNLKVTDISFAWPMVRDISAVGRWTQDWSENRFQNLFYGIQYDTCCWAMQLVAGRSFTGLVNSAPQYNNEVYVQFALKGLGNIGTGNPSNALNNISGYKTQFGQEL